jgi:hypothetical protein
MIKSRYEVEELQQDTKSIFNYESCEIEAYKNAREYDAHTSEATTYRPDQFELDAARLSREENQRKIDIQVDQLFKHWGK